MSQCVGDSDKEGKTSHEDDRRKPLVKLNVGEIYTFGVPMEDKKSGEYIARIQNYYEDCFKDLRKKQESGKESGPSLA